MTEKGRSLVVLAAAVLVAALTARLGFWQLDRAAQKVALQRSIIERTRLPVLPASALAADAAGAAAQEHRRIALEGQWVPQGTVFLDNRQMDQRVGFFVVTPLKLPDGSAVPVQRGWVPRDAMDRTRLPPVPTPTGSVALVGRIATHPARLFEFEASTSGAIRQNLELVPYAIEIGLKLRPVVLLQESAADDGLQRDWPLPAIDVSHHYGYAFQWFALCALVVGLYLWFQILRPRRRRAS